MSATSFDTLHPNQSKLNLTEWLETPLFRRLVLGSILLLAAILRFGNLTALGYVNHYYSAGVVSMLQSWSNFFFVAAEPGGAVSIDKPPVGLWLQAASAYVFGINTFGLLLPQIAAGLGSGLLLYWLVRRWFGPGPGLLASLILAITPVVIATDRNNTIDSTLIFTLLLAAWAFIKATESAKLRYLLLGATLIGIGFNIKMLQAYLPLPAFYALYLLGAPLGIWRKIGQLLLASLLIGIVSLSWAIVVDLTPADQRPYVGSSTNNSVLQLMLGHNGLDRLLGRGQGNGVFSSFFGTNQADGQTPQVGNGGQIPQGGFGVGGPRPQNGGNRPPQNDGQGNGPPGGQFPQGGQGNGFGRGGMSGIGEAGPFRLFTAPLSKEASWLLPFGLLSAGLLAFRTRLRWPLEQKHQAIVLWGGWLITAAGCFSVAGFFHEYYLSILAPPLAALVAIGAGELWKLREKQPWLAIGLLLIASGITLALQISTAQAFVGYAWWLTLSIMAALIGTVLLIGSQLSAWQLGRFLGFSSLILALLITPGIWSALTTLNSSNNQSLPSAYSGQSSGPENRGDIQVNQELLSYLEANTQQIEYLMAVPSSMQGADYVLATGRPVLYMGGFSGQDEVVTSADLAQLVNEGMLRYIYWDSSGRRGFGSTQENQAAISSWVASNCTGVPNFDTAAQNSGAPDGTTGPGMRQGTMQVTLYDCG